MRDQYRCGHCSYLGQSALLLETDRLLVADLIGFELTGSSSLSVEHIRVCASIKGISFRRYLRAERIRRRRPRAIITLARHEWSPLIADSGGSRINISSPSESGERIR